jgi:hypothetical protein
VERLICDRARLGELDSELAEAYQTALRDSPWASANRRIRAEQKAWIARRDRCRPNAVSGSACTRCALGQLHAEVDVEVDGDDGGGAMAGSGGNANPGRMMAICRDRANHVFHVRAGDVDTKYEASAPTAPTPSTALSTCAAFRKPSSARSTPAAPRSIRFVVN